MTDIRRAARWGTWVMCGVLLLVLYRADALENSAGIQRAAYLASIGAWLATAGLMAWPERGTRQRQVLATTLSAVTLAATTAVTLTVPAGLQHTNANWAIGVNGWLLLTIASGVRLSLLVLWLALPVVLALAAAIPAGPPEIAVMCVRALGILGLQVPIALATRALERSAEATRQLQLTQEAIRTEQFVASALHDDRLRRSRTVAAAVEPVLASLAGVAAGTVPDDSLRRSSRIAAAQVRRLLAAWNHDDGDPLGDDLSACLDDLQAAGTRVEVAVHTGHLPPVLRRAALDVVRACARLPVSRLRLTAVPTPTHLSLSVVARTGNPGGPFMLDPVPAPLAIRTTTIDETLWVELTCPL
ncbi:hypothetical protein [Winogradskya humida]|uniref:Signal transduction histidine kinase n=1 Tax=Winogradskya humida TaxID=113566 RepID=A0ABQ3ZYV0_9ACTN|nr:hypothetical protein [Actinoplanes humidus]GIE23603.1 hypothetical protein Ahu01nite_067050 [Actinoplanes humidus]